TRPGAAHPDGRPRMLRRLRRADRVVDAVVLSVIGGALSAPETSRDLERLFELLHADARWWEVVPVRVVLLLLPSGAHAELQPATGYVVHAGRDLGLERGVAVLDGGDEYTQTDALGVPRERRKERPGLEAVLVRRAVGPAEKVVAHPE